MNNNLKEIRRKRNLTQEELAEKLGITRNWLSKIENGKNDPPVSLAVRIANVLDVKVEDIFLTNVN